MSSINKVIIIGNLGDEPELRYTANQTPVANLSVATNDRTGKDKEETTWHRITVWGKTAEACKKYLAKGRSVYVEGRLATRSWEDKKTGEKKFVTEIIASDVRFLGGGKREEAGTNAAGFNEFAGGQGNQRGDDW